MIEIRRVLSLTSLFIQSVLCYVFAIAVCAVQPHIITVLFNLLSTLIARVVEQSGYDYCVFIPLQTVVTLTEHFEREYERFKSVMLSVMKIFHSNFPQMFQFSMMVFKSKFSRLFHSWPYNKLQNQ